MTSSLLLWTMKIPDRYILFKCMGTHIFPSFSQKGNNSVTCLITFQLSPSKMGFTVKRI